MRHAETVRRDDSQDAVVRVSEWAFGTQLQLGTSLRIFTFARLLGRLRALRILASDFNWLDLILLLVQAQQAERHEREDRDDLVVRKSEHPILIRPAVYVGDVRLQATSSF